MKKNKNTNKEIDELYKKLKIDIKQAEKNLKLYTQKNNLYSYNNDYKIYFTNSLESIKK